METLIVTSTAAALGVRPDSFVADAFSRAASFCYNYRSEDNGFVLPRRRNDFATYDMWRDYIDSEQRVHSIAHMMVSDMLDTVPRRRAPWDNNTNSDYGVTHPSGPKVWHVGEPVSYDPVTELKKGGMVGAAIQFGPTFHLVAMDGPNRARRLVALLRQAKRDGIDAVLSYPKSDTEMANAIRATKWYTKTIPESDWVNARPTRPEVETYDVITMPSSARFNDCGGCVTRYDGDDNAIGEPTTIPMATYDYYTNRFLANNFPTMGVFKPRHAAEVQQPTPFTEAPLVPTDMPPWEWTEDDDYFRDRPFTGDAVLWSADGNRVLGYTSRYTRWATVNNVPLQYIESADEVPRIEYIPPSLQHPAPVGEEAANGLRPHQVRNIRSARETVEEATSLTGRYPSERGRWVWLYGQAAWTQHYTDWCYDNEVPLSVPPLDFA